MLFLGRISVHVFYGAFHGAPVLKTLSFSRFFRFFPVLETLSFSRSFRFFPLLETLSFSRSFRFFPCTEDFEFERKFSLVLETLSLRKLFPCTGDFFDLGVGHGDAFGGHVSVIPRDHL